MTAAEASRTATESVAAGRAEPALIRRLYRAAAPKPGGPGQRRRGGPGGLLAAGIGYFSFFSLFPAVALAAGGLRLHPRWAGPTCSRPSAMPSTPRPGHVKTANPSGSVALTAPETATLSWTGAVAIVTVRPVVSAGSAR